MNNVRTHNPQHGFTRVDEDVRPTAWVECLDKLHSEPFYRDYKARVREILSPRQAGVYLDVGAGVGADDMIVGAEVIGVDRSFTMCRESLSRGLKMSVMADAEALPLPSGLDLFSTSNSSRSLQPSLSLPTKPGIPPLCFHE